MRAPFSLRWANASPSYREPRIRCPLKPTAGVLIVGSLCIFVLLVTVTSVSGSLENTTCPIRRDAPDIASRAVVSPQIVQGVLIDMMALSRTSYRASFRVLRVQKRYRGPRRAKKNRRLSFVFRTLYGNASEGEECLVRAKLQRRRKYFLFLNGPSSKKERLRPIGPPAQATRKVRKRIKSVLCDECTFSPSVGRLRDDSVVRGKSVNFTCVFDGHPSPQITWAKDNKPINGSVKIITQKRKLRRHGRMRRRKRRQGRSSRRRKLRPKSTKKPRRKKNRKLKRRQPKIKILSTLSISSAEDSHAGTYSCTGKSVIGEATARADLSVVPPLDPGLVFPCPYDSYCLNGGTCMFFKLFGELVCQCAKGYKGQRCHEKAVYPTFGCSSSSNTHKSRGLRCPRNQPLALWEILQQSLSHPYTVTQWADLEPNHYADTPWDTSIPRNAFILNQLRRSGYSNIPYLNPNTKTTAETFLDRIVHSLSKNKLYPTTYSITVNHTIPRSYIATSRQRNRH